MDGWRPNSIEGRRQKGQELEGVIRVSLNGIEVHYQRVFLGIYTNLQYI
jgi:hypothetical protein